jgi:hypothetical protein
VAKDACPDLIDRVSFTPGQMETAVSRLNSAMATVAGAAASGEEYAPRSPFEIDNRQKAWRLIGRAYAWKASIAIDKEEWGTAAAACVDAHRFAAAMAHGDVGDVSIGVASAAEARMVIAPRLEQMPPDALKALADGMQKALASSPNPENTLANEAKRARLAIQHLQDQFSKRDMEGIKADYGRKAKDGVNALGRLDSNSAAAFFQGLAAEADTTASWQAVQAQSPTTQRSGAQTFGPGDRPWAEFSRHIFQPMESFVEMRDIYIARGRLLILAARIESQIKTAGRAPASLAIFEPALRTDPFTGEDFRYRAAAEEYRLYSVGEDGSDSGGDSDDSGLTPDLILEK